MTIPTIHSDPHKAQELMRRLVARQDAKRRARELNLKASPWRQFIRRFLTSW